MKAAPMHRVLAGLIAPLFLLAPVLPAQAAMGFKTITSPSGITAWFVEDYTVPLVTIGFAFEGGATQDPDDKLGRASLMTTLFDEGAGDLDSEAFQIRLDEVGLDMSFSADQDSISGYARMLADEREEASELLKLAVQSPRFDQEAIDRMRSQVLAGIVAASRDPNRIAGLMWNEALFGDHPYGRPPEGTEQTLPTITPEDLHALHDALFVRGTLKLGIVGAIDEEAAGALIDQVFGDLPETGDLKPIADTEPAFGEELAVDYPLPQSFLNLAYPGIKEQDPDFFPAYVMSEMLAGGSLLSLLNVEVREKRGLSYGVSGGLIRLDHAEAMTIGTSTSPENAAEALSVIEATIAEMIVNGPDPDELERVKRYIIGSYPISQLRSSVAIAGAMIGQQLRGLPIDYVDKRQAMIEAVTAEQVQAVAARIFATQPSIMLVGPGAEKAEVTP